MTKRRKEKNLRVHFPITVICWLFDKLNIANILAQYLTDDNKEDGGIPDKAKTTLATMIIRATERMAVTMVMRLRG